MGRELSRLEREQNLRLREERDKRHFTQEQFADLLEISISSYTKIEQYERPLSLNILKKIHEKANISVDYILYGDKNNAEEIWDSINSCKDDEKMALLLKLCLYFAYEKNGAFPVNISNISDLTGKLKLINNSISRSDNDS